MTQKQEILSGMIFIPDKIYLFCKVARPRNSIQTACGATREKLSTNEVQTQATQRSGCADWTALGGDFWGAELT